MSHELCTPLNGIIGLSYALQASQEVQGKVELSKTLTVITMSGKRLLQLIYDVLDAAKMTADAPLIKRESVNVRALVLDVAMLCSSIVRQGVDLRVQLQPVPRIIGDTGRIVQARSPTRPAPAPPRSRPPQRRSVDPLCDRFADCLIICPTSGAMHQQSRFATPSFFSPSPAGSSCAASV